MDADFVLNPDPLESPNGVAYPHMTWELGIDGINNLLPWLWIDKAVTCPY